VAACVSSCGVCTECRAAALQKCDFSQAQYKLPKDGPGGPKHVGANLGYFNVNFNILYV
jgi:hypothetical protein